MVYLHVILGPDFLFKSLINLKLVGYTFKINVLGTGIFFIY